MTMQLNNLQTTPINNNILLAGLQASLSTPTSRHLFAQALLRCRNLKQEEFSPPNFEAYFSYYQDQCRTAICDEPNSAKSHQDIVELAQQLRNSHLSQIPVITQITADAKYWSEFTIRVLTMIDVGELRQGLRIGQAARTWKGEELKDFVETTFEQKQLPDEQRFEKLFNARNIDRIAGIRIMWTCNLADHLKLEEDDTIVRIFSHASFLELHQHTDIFPPNFIHETLQTLSLLLPPSDKKLISWFQKEQRNCPIPWLIDPHAITLSPLPKIAHHTKSFEFWHDRLVILKQAFDEANPKDMRQLWVDRRQMAQWAYFWYAIILVVGVTVFFGFAQTIIGILQVWKAFHPEKE